MITDAFPTVIAAFSNALAKMERAVCCHLTIAVFLSTSGTAFLLLLSATLTRWWQWARIQPYDDEFLAGESVRTVVVSQRYSRLERDAEQQYEQRCCVLPPLSSFQPDAAFHKTIEALLAGVILGLAAACVTAGAVVWLADSNHPAGPATFALCIVLSLVWLRAAWKTTKKSRKALATEHLPGQQCFEATLVPQYRLRATKTYHTDFVSKLEDVVGACCAHLKKCRANLLSRTVAVRLAWERGELLLNLVKDCVVARQLRAEHPLFAFLVLLFTVTPYVGLAFFLGHGSIKKVAVSLHPCLGSVDSCTWCDGWFGHAFAGIQPLLWCLALPLIDVELLLLYLWMQPESNMLVHYMTARKLAETCLESVWQLLVQGCLLLWEADPFTLSHEGGVDAKWVPLVLSVATSAYLSKTGLDRLKRLASWQSRNNQWRFLKRMQLLGEGLAPSFVLEALYDSAEVDVSAAMLEGLDLGGFQSIVAAISRSKALKRLRVAGEPWGHLLETAGEGTPFNEVAVTSLMGQMIRGMEALEALEITGSSSAKLSSQVRQKFSANVDAHVEAALTFKEGGHTVTLQNTAPRCSASEDIEVWRLALLASGRPTMQQEESLLSSKRALPFALFLLRYGDEAFDTAQRLLVHKSAHGHLGAVQVLLDFGAETQVPEQYGNFALLMAAQEGHAECVHALLVAEAQPQQVNEQSGTFPLLQAAEHAHEECVQALLSAEAEPQQVHKQDGIFPLLQAARSGHAGCVQALLSAKAEPQQVNEHDDNFPLLMAAQNGHAECVQLLLAAKAEPRQVNEQDGLFPLLRAAHFGHAGCVQSLLAAEAEPRQIRQQDGDFPLLVAALQGRAECVRLLLSASAEPRQSNQQNGNFPLLVAAQYGHADCLLSLLAVRAEPQQVNSQDGEFPLLVAALQSRAACVRALLAARASPSQVNAQDGWFALLACAQNGDTECSRALLTAKADPRQGHATMGVLQLASDQGHDAFVQLLVEWSARTRRQSRH